MFQPYKIEVQTKEQHTAIVLALETLSISTQRHTFVSRHPALKEHSEKLLDATEKILLQIPIV